MKIEKTYLQHGVDLEDMSAWEAKNWANEIRVREKAHIKVRAKVMKLICEEYGERSEEMRAGEIVQILAPLFSEIFALQMENPKKMKMSWEEKAPKIVAEMDRDIALLMSGTKYKAYHKYLDLISEVAHEKKPKNLAKLSIELQREGIGHYERRIPMLLSPMGSFKYDQVASNSSGEQMVLEPDIRLLFPHPEAKYDGWIKELKNKQKLWHPNSPKRNFNGAIVVWAAGGGWQVVSPTSGEALVDNWFMVCTNILKAEKWVNAVEISDGVKPGDGETWDALLLLYICHESGHAYTDEGPLEELMTDLPTVLLAMDWDEIDKEKMLRAMKGAYLSEVKERDHTPDNERGYSISANHVMNRMVSTGSFEEYRKVIEEDWWRLYKSDKAWIKVVTNEELLTKTLKLFKQVKGHLKQ